MNRSALYRFRFLLIRLWWRSLKRRSQKSRLPWERMKRYVQRWLPPPRIYHPYPLRRLGVIP
jgi:RNA-directed DNA polymerase